MGIRLFCVWVLVLGSIELIGQSIVFFTNKPDTSLETSSYLSERSISRRENQEIEIDEFDYPVYQPYLDSLIELGVDVEYTSKWLNAVLISSNDQNGAIEALNFVERVIDYSGTSSNKVVAKNDIQETNQITSENTQLHQIGVDNFHANGYEGEGMLIAVIDAGFYHYDELTAFDHLISESRIVETYDFVESELNVADDHEHGMQVLSVIAADTIGGSAEKASFLLYRTENVFEETPIEEFYWAVAAERADSIGADLINASVGYTTFDNSLFDYTHDDLDGETGMISTAATIAGSRGIVVVCSAGNEGGSSWEKLIKPADSKNTLAVGSVKSDRSLSSFSSLGPSADERIKPDVCALGSGTKILSKTGSVITGTGTSLSAPLITGLAACVWEAFPELTSNEVMDLIIESSDRYEAPDNRYGYGIPNGVNIWSVKTSLGDAYTSVFTSILSGEQNFNENVISVVDISGRIVLSTNQSMVDFSMFEEGYYFLVFESGRRMKAFIVK